MAARYRLRLSDELRSWFDDDVWASVGGGEYREALHPEALLADAPEAIWPGLMPPDFLPVISNGAGDWLCLRIGPHGQIAEVVQWYHGGGDWLPWGKSLAEAIVFDAVSIFLPGAPRRHAIPAEPTRAQNNGSVDPVLQWAIQWMPASLQSPIHDAVNHRDSHADSDSPSDSASQLAYSLIDHSVAEVALRSELVQRAVSLHGAPASTLDHELTSRLGITAQQINEWLFDAERIPQSMRAELLGYSGAERYSGAETGSSLSEQDWNAVQQHCEQVTKLAPKLAWGWDLLGYTHQRSGNWSAAASSYQSGLACSVFTDQSIRYRTHWTSDVAAKFSAAMLRRLIDEQHINSDLLDDRSRHYLDVLCDAEPLRRPRAHEHWLHQADLSLEVGNPAQAIDHILLAGWDLGAPTLDSYRNVLEKLQRVCEEIGDDARSELARTHVACLIDRYGG